MNDAYIDICYEASVAIKDGEKTIELALDNFSKIKNNINKSFKIIFLTIYISVFEYTMLYSNTT